MKQENVVESSEENNIQAITEDNFSLSMVGLKKEDLFQQEFLTIDTGATKDLEILGFNNDNLSKTIEDQFGNKVCPYFQVKCGDQKYTWSIATSRNGEPTTAGKRIWQIMDKHHTKNVKLRVTYVEGKDRNFYKILDFTKGTVELDEVLEEDEE